MKLYAHQMASNEWYYTNEDGEIILNDFDEPKIGGN